MPYCPATASVARDVWHEANKQFHAGDTFVGGGRTAKAIAVIQAALDAAKAEQLEACCLAVRSKCEPCGGTGVAETRYEDVIGDDGKGNPVQLYQHEEVIECEYCGRPLAAIRQRKGARHGL